MVMTDERRVFPVKIKNELSYHRRTDKDKGVINRPTLQRNLTGRLSQTSGYFVRIFTNMVGTEVNPNV